MIVKRCMIIMLVEIYLHQPLSSSKPHVQFTGIIAVYKGMEKKMEISSLSKAYGLGLMLTFCSFWAEQEKPCPKTSTLTHAQTWPGLSFICYDRGRTDYQYNFGAYLRYPYTIAAAIAINGI